MLIENLILEGQPLCWKGEMRVNRDCTCENKKSLRINRRLICCKNTTSAQMETYFQKRAWQKRILARSDLTGDVVLSVRPQCLYDGF